MEQTAVCFHGGLGFDAVRRRAGATVFNNIHWENSLVWNRSTAPQLCTSPLPAGRVNHIPFNPPVITAMRTPATVKS